MRRVVIHQAVVPLVAKTGTADAHGALAPALRAVPPMASVQGHREWAGRASRVMQVVQARVVIVMIARTRAHVPIAKRLTRNPIR